MKTHLPNVLTFGNLTLGILAILSVFPEEYTLSSMLIILAAFMDRFDGQLARKLDVESEIGKQLDSLSDLISFGVAPAILIWSYSLQTFGFIGIIIIVLFAVSGAYRLAKFNVTDFTGIFSGIPITLAGGFVALLTLYSINYYIHDVVLLIIVPLLSYSMISKKIQFKKK
jgi:CDP-diacylglycerol---serine O-phosphatidyltransferase